MTNKWRKLGRKNERKNDRNYCYIFRMHESKKVSNETEDVNDSSESSEDDDDDDEDDFDDEAKDEDSKKHDVDQVNVD